MWVCFVVLLLTYNNSLATARKDREVLMEQRKVEFRNALVLNVRAAILLSYLPFYIESPFRGCLYYCVV